ncbi:MAG: LysE family translocator [Caldilineaceae bacterium]
MSINLLPTLSYILICTFTPGPSNISSTSLALLYGYKNTLWYQGGLAVGVFLFMLVSGLVSATVLRILPMLEPILRYCGATYILYLAYSISKASYDFADQTVKPLGFSHGLTLQLLNPKIFIYAFTLFSTFLASIALNVPALILAALLLAAISFVATSLWALFGATIKGFLHIPRLRLVINLVLALSLIYAALALVGFVA